MALDSAKLTRLRGKGYQPVDAAERNQMKQRESQFVKSAEGRLKEAQADLDSTRQWLQEAKDGVKNAPGGNDAEARRQRQEARDWLANAQTGVKESEQDLEDARRDASDARRGQAGRESIARRAAERVRAAEGAAERAARDYENAVRNGTQAEQARALAKLERARERLVALKEKHERTMRDVEVGTKRPSDTPEAMPPAPPPGPKPPAEVRVRGDVVPCPASAMTTMTHECGEGGCPDCPPGYYCLGCGWEVLPSGGGAGGKAAGGTGGPSPFVSPGGGDVVSPDGGVAGEEPPAEPPPADGSEGDADERAPSDSPPPTAETGPEGDRDSESELREPDYSSPARDPDEASEDAGYSSLESVVDETEETEDWHPRSSDDAIREAEERRADTVVIEDDPPPDFLRELNEFIEEIKRAGLWDEFCLAMYDFLRENPSLILTALGLIPGLGEFFDALDLIISLARVYAAWRTDNEDLDEDLLEVGLSGLALVPLGGQIPGVAKFLKRIAKWQKSGLRAGKEILTRLQGFLVGYFKRAAKHAGKSQAWIDDILKKLGVSEGGSAPRRTASPPDSGVAPGSGNGGRAGTSETGEAPAGSASSSDGLRPSESTPSGGSVPDARPPKGERRPSGSRKSDGKKVSPEVELERRRRRERKQGPAQERVRSRRAELEPGVHEMPDGSRVHIDEHGRTTRVEVDEIRTDQPAKRRKHLEAQVGHVGGYGYEGGHLYGRQFGGASEVQNLVPMSSRANREFLQVEREMAAAKGVTGYSVQVAWGESLDVPRAFLVRATVTAADGSSRPVHRVILNTP